MIRAHFVHSLWGGLAKAVPTCTRMSFFEEHSPARRQSLDRGWRNCPRIELHAFSEKGQVEVVDILSKLDQSQREIIASWLSHQHRLETDGPKGFSNVSVLTAWLLTRKFAISDANLTTALGNAQNSGHRKIFWKALPKESREYVQGRPNHAFGETEKPKAKAATVQQQEYVNGRKNHAYVPPEEAAKKVAVEATDAWQQICQLHSERVGHAGATRQVGGGIQLRRCLWKKLA